jgi:predicted TIM-barrel fold metal-dependent hydrolase
MLIHTHVHVWPLDDAPGHRPVPGAKVSHPKEAAPVEWLLQDMEDFGVDHCVLVQSSALVWRNLWQGGRSDLDAGDPARRAGAQAG